MVLNFSVVHSFSGSIKFTTLLGGGSSEIMHGVALYYPIIGQAATTVIFTGVTSSNNIPTRNPFQGALAGGQDYFIGAYSVNGTRIFSSYFGGVGSETSAFCGVDSIRQSLILCGQSASSGLAFGNVFDSVADGNGDIVIASFNISSFTSGEVCLDENS